MKNFLVAKQNSDKRGRGNIYIAAHVTEKKAKLPKNFQKLRGVQQLNRKRGKGCEQTFHRKRNTDFPSTQVKLLIFTHKKKITN